MINAKLHTCGCGPELGREQTNAGEAYTSLRQNETVGKKFLRRKGNCLNVSSSFARGK